ncbi:MAG: L-threonylcarbamoyladenylate synthase [Euryarchaeota archaeon]|nr:L-threonylcarbamoyladenylate synthase [Euryarchaeota archaeon]
METRIIRMDPDNLDTKKIKEAAEFIKNGELVAFPTETVYGLGANTLNADAVRKIFEAKNRPADNPIINHIAKKEWVYKLAKEVPEDAIRLADVFWPGPLTMIFKKKTIVPDVVTGGLKTTSMRMPRNKIALNLITYSQCPIAAPSANLSGKPSPTTAEHVIHDLSGRIACIIDAGSTDIGVESTVIDLSVSPPLLLRPGGVTYEDLREYIDIEIHPAARAVIEMKEKTASPGMKYRHYAPTADLILVEGDIKKVVKKIRGLCEENSEKKIGIIVTEETKNLYDADVKIIGRRKKMDEVAENLFRILREFDNEGVDIILSEGFSTEGLGLAVMNRLRKAAKAVITV